MNCSYSLVVMMCRPDNEHRETCAGKKYGVWFILASTYVGVGDHAFGINIRITVKETMCCKACNYFYR